MIRYQADKRELERLIEAECPGWLDRAKKRTDTFSTLGAYDESSSIWSEVKIVYMRLQNNKCAYCERELESGEFGRIEHDLEHFRPKKKARAWKIPGALKNESISLTPPASGNADPGYHLLPYHPLNYCTSCKTCNSTLKKDFFPIEGPRHSMGTDPTGMSAEKPLLVNPVGAFDTDPEELIAFHGVSPMAHRASGYKRRRGLVCIAFFRLDDKRRKSLFRQRADVIVSIYSFLKNIENSPATKQTFERLVDAYLAPTSPHTNCARSYKQLYDTDRQEAEEIFRLAAEYLDTISS